MCRCHDRSCPGCVDREPCSRCSRLFDADHLDARRRCDGCAAEVAAELADDTTVNACPHCTARRQCPKCFDATTEAPDHDVRCRCVLCRRHSTIAAELEDFALDLFERSQHALMGSEVSL